MPSNHSSRVQRGEVDRSGVADADDRSERVEWQTSGRTVAATTVNCDCKWEGEKRAQLAGLRRVAADAVGGSVHTRRWQWRRQRVQRFRFFVSLVRRDHKHSRAARIKYIWIGIVTIIGKDQSANWTQSGDEAVEKRKKEKKKACWLVVCALSENEDAQTPRLHATSTKRHAPTRHGPG